MRGYKKTIFKYFLVGPLTLTLSPTQMGAREIFEL
jgi:hypothetical protein